MDNLHVVHDLQWTGLGTRLLARAAQAVIDRATGSTVKLRMAWSGASMLVRH